jgi:hypothetical protein
MQHLAAQLVEEADLAERVLPPLHQVLKKANVLRFPLIYFT